MKNLCARRPVPVVAATVIVSLAASCGYGSKDPGSTPTRVVESGTSGPVAEPTSPVTIEFSSWVGEHQGMKNLYKAFRKEHPNITVKFQNVPAEQSGQKLTTQIAGGNPPDAAFIDAGTVASFASRNALINLDSYISRGNIVDTSDYVPAFKQFAVHDNSMYGLPIDGESTALFYRKDLFTAAGIAAPPATWQEFEAAAQKLTDPKRKKYGYDVFASDSAYYWYPWLWQNGGKLMSDDGKTVEFNSAAAKESAEYYNRLVRYSPPDYLNSNPYDGRTAFASGQVDMYMAGAWFAGVLEEEYSKIKDKWAAVPLPEGKAGCATTIAGDSLVLFSKGDQRDAAWKWVEFLSSEESHAEWTYKSGETLLPPRTSMLESPDLLKTVPLLNGFAEAMKCGVVSVSPNPKWPQIESALNKELGKAMYGEQSASKALDNAAAAAAKIMR